MHGMLGAWVSEEWQRWAEQQVGCSWWGCCCMDLTSDYQADLHHHNLSVWTTIPVYLLTILIYNLNKGTYELYSATSVYLCHRAQHTPCCFLSWLHPPPSEPLCCFQPLTLFLPPAQPPPPLRRGCGGLFYANASGKLAVARALATPMGWWATQNCLSV